MKVDQLQPEKGEFSILSHFSIPGRRRAGFTLIEMLVVIVIVAILMGIVFKLSRGVMSRNESAREVARVAILKAMIEEFHAEYGIYPPVPEYDGVQPVSFTGPFPKDGADLNYYISHYAYSKDHPFKFGLLSFFLNREEFGAQTFRAAGGRDGNETATDDWERYNDRVGNNGAIKVSDKDRAFVKRVKPILDKLANEFSNFTAWTEYDEDGHTKGFSAHAHDSWDRSYVYVSEPPYTSFIVFSKGPDGTYDKDHPADRSRPANKDNIYGDLGDK